MPVKLGPNDPAIYRMIYAYGGVVRKNHLKAKIWPMSRSDDAMDKRLRALVNNGWLGRPNDEEAEKYPSSKGSFWLGPQAEAWLASNTEQYVPVTKPPLKKIDHDLKLADFHFAIEEALALHPHLKLETWQNHTDTRSKPVPDAFFVISDHNRPGLAARLLVELDNCTHSHGAFITEKILGGLEYLQSEAYRQFTGSLSGRWLMIIDCPRDSARRMQELLVKTAEAVPDYAYVFLFTTPEQIAADGDPLISPIWQAAGKETKQSLLEE